MAARNELVDRAIDELALYGLKGEVSHRGKHIEIAWNTAHGRRFVIVAATGSDWRAGMNTRAQVRKLLRADNMQPMRISNVSLQRALSLPKETLPQNQVLQNDVDALVELVCDMQTQIEALQNKIDSMRVVSHIEFGSAARDVDVATLVIEQPEALPKVKKAIPFREGSSQAAIYNLLTDKYVSIHEIVKQSGQNLKYVSATLWKAKKKGFVELGLRGMYRRKAGV